ncbi:MAG: PilN domain-containing protein [candidate division Zixibacteria bacterium]|nr:PilN domain-containing protein [candidate division Zixibacteria bacterium]
MIKINLLPKELRKRKGITLKKNSAYLLGGSGIIIILLILITIMQGVRVGNLNRRITEAKKRKEALKDTIRLVDALSDLKNKILQRLSAIESLDKDRSTWIDIMEDLSSRVPDNLWLTNFKENTPSAPTAANVQVAEEESDTLKAVEAVITPPIKRIITIEGYSFSLSSLATFMINLIKSSYFDKIELNNIKLVELEKQKVYSFQLNSELLYASQVSTSTELAANQTGEPAP